MATDFAKIGFGVDTSQLERGVAALNTFNSSAKSANSTAKSIGAAMNSSSKVFAAAVSAMSKSIASLVSVTKGATVEQIAAAKEASDFADRVYRAAKAQNTLASSVQKTARALKDYSVYIKAASNESVLNRINRLTGVTGLTALNAEDVAGRMKKGMSKKEWSSAIGESLSSRGLTEAQQTSRFNTSNIAAQFQDIAVTAAMGMNPMTIALQQGSQLVGVLNLMEKPLTGIVQAFKSLFNTTSLVTIGLTGLVAAGLQMVDWTSVAQSGLNGLASAMDFVANNADSFASVLTGVVAIIGVIKFESIKTGLMAVASAATTVFKTLTSWSKLVAIINNVKKSIAELNIVIWATKNPVKAVTAAILAGVTAWAAFSESGRKAINSIIGYTLAAAYSIGGAMEAGFSSIYKGFDEAFGELKTEMSEIAGKDYVGAIGDIVESSMKKASESMKEWSKGLTETDEKTKKLKKAWEDLQASALKDISDVRMDRSLLGKSTYDATYERTEYELINQAKQQGLTLDKDRLKIIKELSASKAEETVLLEAETAKLKAQNEVLDFYKSTTKSFFSDLKQGLREGKSAWESFANVVLNVLDKIADKMMDVAIDALFDNSSSSKKSGGGWLNSLINFGMQAGLAYVTGGGGQSANFSTASGGFDYAGYDTAFNQGMMDAGLYAKGGVFTNGVYDSPTMFKFANGGKFGVMGEAGPEAVMPLRRGSDGSLGVKADGFVGGDVVVNVINNSDSTARTEKRQTENGTEIDVIIDRMVANKMNENGSASNSALVAFNNRSLTLR